jgi:hypothetical protein
MNSEFLPEAVEHNLILIVAVAHQKRRPRYWRARIKQIKERQAKKQIEEMILP